MASQVKVLQSDIKGEKQKLLLTNIVKFALSGLITQETYRKQLEDEKVDMADLMKQTAFRKEFIFMVYNQLIRGNLEHYVVLLGQEYMIQVKYRKNSMIKFDILGNTLLLYEVPYIAVPTLSERNMVKDEELNAIETKVDEQIKIEEKQFYTEDEKFDYMKEHITKGLKETLQWYYQSDPKDERNDNLSAVLLSRFAKESTNYHWHIIFGTVVPENSKSGSILTGHQVRINQMDKMIKPVTRIKLGFFMRVHAYFPYKSKKSGKEQMKKVEVVVFNQQNNPQTSVESVFSGFKTFSFKNIFSLNTLAVLAFLCILGIFILQNRLCHGYDEEEKKIGDLGIPKSDDIILDPSDIHHQEGVLASVCRFKSHFLTNLGIAFLLLTVVRQYVMRMKSKQQQ